MSDWRIPLATDLARRAHGAGAREGDRGMLKSCFHTLAEQEKDFLRKNPDRVHEAIGYARAQDEYGPNGIGMLISMAFKYWPVAPAETVDPDVLSRLEQVEPVQTTKPTPPVPEPPKPPKKSAVGLLETIHLVFQVSTDSEYDENTVLETLQSFAGDGVTFTEAYRDGLSIDLLCEVRTFILPITEKLREVPWLTDVLTKPASLYRLRF